MTCFQGLIKSNKDLHKTRSAWKANQNPFLTHFQGKCDLLSGYAEELQVNWRIQQNCREDDSEIVKIVMFQVIKKDWTSRKDSKSRAKRFRKSRQKILNIKTSACMQTINVVRIIPGFECCVFF